MKSFVFDPKFFIAQAPFLMEYICSMRLVFACIFALHLLLTENVLAVVAGDPAGTPPDSPAARVDPNTINSPFAGVGSIFLGPPGGSGFMGTGTLISPWHVLTAAHLLDSDNNGTIDYSPDHVTFFLNAGGNQTHSLTASTLNVHPNFTGVTVLRRNDDVAVITLATPAFSVPTYPILHNSLALQSTLEFVGYGQTGDGVNGYI